MLTNLRVPLLSATLWLGQLGCGLSEPPATAAPSVAEPPPAPSAEPVSAAPPQQAEKPSATVAAKPGETTVRKLGTRNPFRPPTVEVRHLTAQQTTTADIRLLGFAQKESQRFALLVKEGAIRQVQAGDTLGAWEVREVGAATVRLRRGREEIVLQID